MNLDLDPTQELLRDTVREFLRSEVPLDRIRALEREQRWDEALWKALCGQGWLGLPFAEAHGGGGGSLVDAGVLVEELARRAAIVPLVEAIACGVALERSAPGAATDALVAGAALGRGRAGAGRARGERRLRAHRARARRRAPARREALRRLRPVRHPSPRRGARPRRARAVPGRCARGRGRGAAAAHDRAHAVPRPCATTARARSAWRVRPRSRRCSSSAARSRRVQCVGSAAQALDLTVAYASVREAFGRPIGSFQAVKHHAANMSIKVAASRHLAFEALGALERGLRLRERRWRSRRRRPRAWCPR